MDYIYVHLLLNHIPSLGGIFGMILFLFGFLRKNKTLLNAGLVTLVVVAVFTIPTYMSGEEAEHVAEKFAGTSEHFLEEHEEWSEAALWVMISTGILALLSLLLSSMQSIRNILHYLVILASVVSIVLMVIVGNYGGKIRHSELREKTMSASEQVDIDAHDHDLDDD